VPIKKSNKSYDVIMEGQVEARDTYYTDGFIFMKCIWC